MTTEQYVNLLYLKLLGRLPDTEGLAYYVDRVESGESLQVVIDAIVASAEYRDTQNVKYVPSTALSSFSLTAFLTLLKGANYADRRHLIHGYGQVYSQHCEDGFIAEIFSRIGLQSRSFLEIGIGNGLQNTTRFLLEQGWTGVWVEADHGLVMKAKQLFADFVEKGFLNIVHADVTVENVNQCLDQAQVAQSFDLLSVDIDFNTSHLWRALNRQGRVACIEYNASLPPHIALEVPYEPTACWDGTNWFGASLKAIENIGRQKGLSLVGCDPFGVNAYLVREHETGDRFLEPFTSQAHYELPKFDLASHLGHKPSLLSRVWLPST